MKKLKIIIRELRKRIKTLEDAEDERDWMKYQLEECQKRLSRSESERDQFQSQGSKLLTQISSHYIPRINELESENTILKRAIVKS